MDPLLLVTHLGAAIGGGIIVWARMRDRLR
jgi:hypothetical protein